MKVLVVTAMYPRPDNPAFGSFVRTQVEALKRRGVEVELIVLDGRVRKLIYPKGVVRLRRRLVRHPVDLVHAHYGYVGIVARSQSRAPIVVSFHGDDVLGTIDERGRRTRASRLVIASSRLLANHVDAVIVQSREMAAQLDGDHVHIVPHEIDFEVFRPAERADARAQLGLHPTQPYLLFASPPDIAVKRFPFAADVAERLRRSGTDVELLVVHQETQERLALYMSGCDALIFPSFQEGSPNVVKQAMACNLPIVATDVGDVRDTIAATDGCFVCKPDIDEFARRLEPLLAAPRRTHGRDHVRHLRSDVVAVRVVHVYEEALARSASRRARPTLAERAS